MAKTISLQVEKPEAELPLTAKELEGILQNLGAEITHPVRMDPVATINGKVVAFWTE